jgi:Holliday junction resolvase RusA-like endonuclease
MRITILGKPIHKKRPRFARHGRFITTYSDQKDEQNDIRLIIKSQLSCEPLTCPICLEVKFYMPIPKSYSKKKRERLIGRHHTKKPDIDNLEKFICDCLNGIAWRDDAQVAISHTEKIYDENPRTEITIEEII